MKMSYVKLKEPVIVSEVSELHPLGISVKCNGIGDGVQFTSLPENYYRATGKKLIDLSGRWFFDHNPYILRPSELPKHRAIELWNFSPRQWDWPKPKERTAGVYLSNAEIWASLFGVPAVLSRPRLYFCEDFPYEDRADILFQTHGKSHGTLPEHVIRHVIDKYGPTKKLFHLGVDGDPDYGLPTVRVKSFWELAQRISSARMLIGPDSGPSWISACYPDVLTKIVRMKPTPEHFKTWTPLEQGNIHSHWDDRVRQIHNPTDDDIGFTWSYRRL